MNVFDHEISTVPVPRVAFQKLLKVTHSPENVFAITQLFVNFIVDVPTLRVSHANTGVHIFHDQVRFHVPLPIFIVLGLLVDQDDDSPFIVTLKLFALNVQKVIFGFVVNVFTKSSNNVNDHTHILIHICGAIETHPLFNV